jgi:NAD(P)-dependent dehydrogenase (short-subunit alcohol dehydrogenase family)
MFDLTGKRAFVTGGASGIGLAVAKGMKAQGAEVVIADVKGVEESASSAGLLGVHCDVSDENSVRDALRGACGQLHTSLDIVVLNAGVGDVGDLLADTTIELMERVTKVNYFGVMLGLKYAPAHMNDGGAIICTSSMAAHINLPGSAAYSASKKAVVSLTEMAALELGMRQIRVNCVCPGYTDTAMGSGDEGRILSQHFTALGRGASVDDLIGSFVFLASDASRYITGHALNVDGGWSCGPTSQLLETVMGSSVSPV